MMLVKCKHPQRQDLEAVYLSIWGPIPMQHIGHWKLRRLCEVEAPPHVTRHLRILLLGLPKLNQVIVFAHHLFKRGHPLPRTAPNCEAAEHGTL